MTKPAHRWRWFSGRRGCQTCGATAAMPTFWNWRSTKPCWPAWHRCPCCTMNASRPLASVGGSFFSASDTDVAVHLCGGATADLALQDGSLQLSRCSDYPCDGRIRVELGPDKPRDFVRALRIPGWARNHGVSVNGAEMGVDANRGRARIWHLMPGAATNSWPPPAAPVPAVPGSGGCKGGLAPCRRVRGDCEVLIAGAGVRPGATRPAVGRGAVRRRRPGAAAPPAWAPPSLKSG